MFPRIVIANYSISTYTVMALLGLLAAFLLALLKNRRYFPTLSEPELVFAFVYATTGAVIGAKLFGLIGYVFKNYRNNNYFSIMNLSHILNGSGVFYGGLFGGFIFVLIFAKKKKIAIKRLSDLLLPSLLIFHTFGRIGCLFAGCCYGIESSWGIVDSSGTVRLPVQLFEAIFVFSFLCVIQILHPERKWKGILLPLYLVVYPIGRFFLEFLRGDVGRGIYILSVSQWISLGLLPIGIVGILKLTKKEVPKKQKNNQRAVP